MQKGWHFWIDTGGTFTDCVACDPQGRISNYKILSSGVIKGRVAPGSSTRYIIIDQERIPAPAAFFQGYGLTLFDAQGVPWHTATVERFHARQGALQLQTPLPEAPQPGQALELSCGQLAPLVAMRYLMGLSPKQPLENVRQVRLGTTRGTNALLQRRGCPTALVTTAGFGDVLAIGYQQRPHLFALHIRKPEPLYAAVVEIEERLDAQGRVLLRPQPQRVRTQLQAVRAQGIKALAVCLLHSYRNPVHEQLVASQARDLGFEYIALSSAVAPVIKIVPRGDTTVLDAYLTPVLQEYLAQLRASLPADCILRVMTSAGGLVAATSFSGKDSILSGPAGGVVGFARVAQEAGFDKAIGFDMGGTSTDVSRYDGRFDYQYETEKAGVRICTPMLAIETVAAGGGSLCAFDGHKLVVGPQSAGAQPGPACYGRGGPLALTDINLYLGKILPEFFPFPLDCAAVQAHLKELASTVASVTGKRLTPQQLAEGFIQIANANMAAPIKRISIAKGYDLRQYVLVSFGGAGGQHACGLARLLGMRQILCHPYAGVLSAYGLGLAHVKRFAVSSVLAPYNAKSHQRVLSLWRQMENELRVQLLAEGLTPEQLQPPVRLLDMRYQGQNSTLSVVASQEDYAQAFCAQHQQLYGHLYPGRPIEIVAVRLEMSGVLPRTPPEQHHPVQRQLTPLKTTKVIFGGRTWTTAVFQREQLQAGDRLDGPAIIIEPTATLVVDPGWQLVVTVHNNLLLTDRQGAPQCEKVACTLDPVQLEIFHNQFAHIAEQMGTTLEKIALSTNIKERRDFSCAVFTPEGDLVANAPHIPVHLGGMASCLRHLRSHFKEIAPGDVLLTNDPLQGGSHLPDLTVATPVHDQQGRLIFWVANRAHHAEIGGQCPGSFPPDSTNLAQEGVLIRPCKIVAHGQLQTAQLRRLLTSGPYPSRTPDENLADISAQIAANQVGSRQLQAMVERYGVAVVHAYMQYIQQAAEAKMRQSLRRIPNGQYHFKDYLDNGAAIQVSITLQNGEAQIDFRGTAPVMPGNLNANRAIVTSAVLYAFRCLIQEDLPLNAGVLVPLHIHIPPGLLDPPAAADAAKCPAVVGGNVETSQRIVDVIFGALGTVAASQGTMNNFIFGNEHFGYYETLAGGAGAGPGFDGASAVHTHMTNTRLTDSEVLESRYPVRIRRFQIRRGSGGAGRHRGGDGLCREVEFLEPLQVAILSQRRLYAPYGLQGGSPGACGRNYLIRPGQPPVLLDPLVQLTVQPGERILIQTPGGGGYGAPGIDQGNTAARG